MKLLFGASLVVLCAALALTRWSEPDLRSDVPIIYWVIDPAPVRAQHIRLFHHWQIKHGHCTEYRLTRPAEVDAFWRRRWSPVIAQVIREANDFSKLPVTVRVPKCEMRVDAASNDTTPPTAPRMCQARPVRLSSVRFGISRSRA